MTVTIRHTQDGGTTLHGVDQIPDDVLLPFVLGSSLRWRYSRHQACYYSPRSRDRVPSLGAIECFLSGLRSAGVDVAADVDVTDPRPGGPVRTPPSWLADYAPGLRIDNPER